MPIPESIKKFKEPGTEIQEHNGHYYVYDVKGVYSKSNKKNKRVSLGCIGQIYEDKGFVPNKKYRREIMLREFKQNKKKIL